MGSKRKLSRSLAKGVLDWQACILGGKVKNPFGKASGQLSLAAHQIERKLSRSLAKGVLDWQACILGGKVNAVGCKDISLEGPREAITELVEVLRELSRIAFVEARSANQADSWRKQLPHKDFSISFCRFELTYSAKNTADFREFIFAQLWSPGIVTGFASNDALLDQCPQDAADVAFHRRNKKNFAQLVH